ncbi:hypothetical protein Rhe02_57210 [Rhizocola hellebori]|uniref:Choice-of-anchor D domain-containing protein n=1 Tax=Rhizocola hellebori TaxID=1392758 RepID=A0A8J3QDA2_9ACTN|nr:ThuA domain-containing protein [Rhizocola hellebori]GIH07654.1 hypothetical protein Rhe02_57210 [Rhizocola hellebori]
MSALRRVMLCAVLVATALIAPTPTQAAPYNVLVFSKTAGFRHDSIAAGITAIQQLGAANNFTVTATEDAAAFTDANLANYATVVWLHTTGDVLDANQQAAFERYIRAGHGYAGVHSAADTEYGWAWYGNLVGAYFAAHPAGTPTATVKVEDPAHNSTAHLPARWSRLDELYNFQTNPRSSGAHVLASLDERSYSGGTMGADHPIAWCKAYDGGRSWYTGLGHTIESYSDTAFRNHLLGGIQTSAGVVGADCKASLTGSFSKVTLDSNTQNPMELDVAPDGRVFYIERDGRVQIIKPATGTTVTAISLSVFTGNEDGLLGIRLDPNFASNGWVYLYYAPPAGGARNQISRFTVVGDSISLSSEVVLLQVPTQRNTCCHAGGSMTFDAAGNLYLATGDNTNPFESDGYAPLDERAGRQDFDSQRTSGNTNDLRGKIIRIHPEANGTYTIPSGNLFPVGTALTKPEIFAMGFRNPFRIGTDKATNTLYVADYGPDAGAENPNRGPSGTVEWNIVTAGNYGWPYCHGNNYAYNDWTFPSGPSGPKFNCAAPVNNSPNNTGLQNLPPARAATVDYDYDGNPLFPEIGGGGAPMGGPVYRFNAALNSARKWPAYWDGKALFGEWNQNKMYTMQVTPDGKSLVDINQLLPGINVLRPMDLEFGPDGAMYLIEWGTGFGGNNADSGIYRIDYTVGDAAPIAVASGTPTSGPTPLTVNFSSAGSNDPGGQPITYAWTFGDGGTSTAQNPSHTYATAGNYTAQLTVRDPGGQTGVANVPITVGNTAPIVNLTFPADGGVFGWGDQVRYTATVTDPEDGTANCSRMVLQYYLGHDEHGHPIQNYTGCSGLVQIPASSGHGDDSNVFSVFEAVYADNGGLVGRKLIQLQPKRKQAEHFTSTGRAPGAIGGGDPGVQRETASDPAGGFQNIGFIEDGDYWSFSPVNLTNITAIGFRVASAAAGGRIEVRTGSASGTLLGTATFAATGGWQTYIDVSTAINTSTASGPLFFVAKNPTGNTGQGPIMNVNWVDFVGRGMADSSALTISPSSAAFGSLLVGQTSSPQAITVSNPNPGPANISSVTVSGQFTQTNSCPTQLGAGASCTINVRFAPTSAGTQAGTLSVANSTTPQPLTVALTGTGISGTSNLALGKPITASSQNNGFVAGNANDNNPDTYWESANNAFPQWIQVDLGAPTQVGSVTLRLPPATSWGTRTQTLSVQGSNDGTTFSTLSASAGRVFDPATGNQVAISFAAASVRYVRVNITANTGWPAGQVSEFQIFPGTGTPTATLSAAPTSLSFGSVNVGTTTNPQTFTVTNTGTAAATLSSITAASQFAQTNNCGSTLAAGASCIVSVTFSPTSAGAKTGTVTVNSNATNPALAVNVTGTGVTPGSATLTASPTSLNLGTVNVGATSPAMAITIANTGSVAASVTSIAAASQFGQTNNCGSSIAAGASCTVNVTFSPTSAGAKTGTLTVNSNATNPTLTVNLSGTGTTGGVTNLALNRPVSGNSNQNFVPGNSVDGNADSYWESPNNAFPQSITVDLGVSATISSIVLKLPPGWGSRNQTLQILGSTNGSTFNSIVASTTYTFNPSTANTVTINVPAGTTATHVRVTISANTGWPAGQLSELQVMGTSGSQPNPDLALNRPITASSITQTYVATNAVDGNSSTYWESAAGFPQTLTVDLGSSQSVSRVSLNLPPAASWSTRQQILSVEGSPTGTTYSTIVASSTYTFNPATGNTVTITFSSASTRFVRLNFTSNTGAAGAQLSVLSVYAA